MEITEIITEKEIIIGLKSREKEPVLSELLKKLQDNGLLKNLDKVMEIILEREKLGSTGIGQGIAVPHAKTDEVDKLVCAMGISKTGVSFDSLDGEPVYIIFLVLAPLGATGDHLKALAKISRLLKDRVFRNSLLGCQTSAEAYQIIKEDEQRLDSIK